MRDVLADAVRFLSIDMVQKANSGHAGMPMGIADVVTVLYRHFLRFNPHDPKWLNRDRFILSAGHGSALLYSVLYLTGYEDATLEQLKDFRQLHSKTAGHPEYGLLDGIEVTTGPLGQGIANAVGMAISERMLNSRFGDELINHKIYTVCGDGCLMEGISQEAISLAGHLKLRNLVLIFDDNGISIDGSTAITSSDDHIKRFEASGWNTIGVNGHSISEIKKAFEFAQDSDKPVFIACKTTIGFGSPTKAGTAAVHGAPLGEDEIKKTRKVLEWSHKEFEIPENILAEWRSLYKRNMAEYNHWDKVFADSEKGQSLQNFAHHNSYIKLAREELATYKKLLADSDLASLEATRHSSGNVIEKLAGVMSNLVGGSADLTDSNATKSQSQLPIRSDNYSGNYIHYGVREHAMAAIMNGLSLSGCFIPYGGTFLAFADYCRPAIRLSAIMERQVIYIMTHDSIGLGEDGRTHQPVEHLASLRAMPNLYVFRPCDAVETLECWDIALQSEETPSLITLTRQKLKRLRKKYIVDNLVARGAYIIKDTKSDPDITIFASGSEVEIALDVMGQLKGKNVRVVSVPCMELFKEQDMEYKISLMCNKSLKIVIEAGVKQGWEYMAGSHAMFFTMDDFGESGKAEQLYEHFGFNAQKIAQEIENVIAGK